MIRSKLLDEMMKWIDAIMICDEWNKFDEWMRL